MFDGLFTALNTETVALMEFCSCIVAIIIMLKYFGISGLYVYISIIPIIANIQALRVISFSFIGNPIALGTITFSTSFVVGNIMTEYYGSDKARLGVLLSFAGQILFSLIMFLTIHYPAAHSVPAGVLNMQTELSHIFTPIPYLLTASILTFIISQYINIVVYNTIKRITPENLIWIRSLISIVLSTLVDNVIYAVLAWKVFCALTIGWSTLFSTYILGNYAFTVIISLCSSPIVFLVRKFVPKGK